MNSKTILYLAVATALSPTACARMWTDTTGRKIDAEMAGVEGDKVLLDFRGKRISLALDRLSLADRAFITDWHKDGPAEAAPAAGKLTLCGKSLTPGGGVIEVDEPISAEALKAFSRSKEKPAKLEIAVALPADFDPAKPQRVMWVSAAINNDAERKAGNIGSIRTYADAATDAGWVVIATDTDLGNPRGDDNQTSKGIDLALQRNAVETLTKAWPGFAKWDFACCGYSGGAKATFFRAGELVACDLNVIGMYLTGCNEDLTAAAKEETRARSAGMRKIRVFISNGRDDKISTVAHAERLQKSLEGGPYAKVRMELFDGGHDFKREEFKKAMTWFLEPAGK